MCERNWSTYDFIHNKKRNLAAWDSGEEELEEE
jgi:hypothetical protein